MIRVTSCCVLLQLYLYYISFLLQTHLPKTLNLQTRERAKWMSFTRRWRRNKTHRFYQTWGWVLLNKDQFFTAGFHFTEERAAVAVFDSFCLPSNASLLLQYASREREMERRPCCCVAQFSSLVSLCLPLNYEWWGRQK